MIKDLKINEITNKYICPYCGKEYCKFGISYHIWKNHTEKGKNFNPNAGFTNGTRTAWNKGLTKETDERVRKYSETFKQRVENGEIEVKGHPHTEECKKRMSERAKQQELGGWCSSKRIDYNGVILQSTYELEFAKDLDKNGIKWTRPKPFHYNLNNSEHRYYPDFYIESLDVYVDPKNDFLINYVNPRYGISDTEKIQLVEQQNNIRVIILSKNELSYSSLLDKMNKIS